MQEGRFLGDDPRRDGHDDTTGRLEGGERGQERPAARPEGDGGGHGLGGAEDGAAAGPLGPGSRAPAQARDRGEQAPIALIGLAGIAIGSVWDSAPLD